ncbi:MAG TPA: rod shape-determining protein MreD [Clostridiaceae bacterium]|jgi:rod shape-determining protein mreD|nr:rod shape-determining protein MreD [Clostridium sp.]MEE0126900.1 rod shape-determining protein MreD [Clostridia bacterium]HJJ12038.1 rod shape-determining protein MreD [Clostridiaceae bacterium]
MKKTVSILLILLAFLIIYFLQANVFTWFNIAGVMPNLFIILVLVIGLFAGKYVGISVGVVAGLLLDIFIGKKIGVTAITLGIVGFVGSVLDKNFSKDSRITLVLMVMFLTVAYELLNYSINAIIYTYSLELAEFFIKLAIETIFNVLLTIILYPLIQKCGYILEENFKETKILTRYF